MAGQGSRFSKAGYQIPKPLIEVEGKTLAEHSIETLGIDGKFIFITRSFDNPEHNEQLTNIFSKLCKDFVEVRVDDKHLGAAHSASFAEHFVDPEEPLIITNCDQHLNWNGKDFMKFIEATDRYFKMSTNKEKSVDGAVVLYKSSNPKNSFAMLKDDQVIAIAEKQPISQDALIGVHYWKHAKDFFDSTRKAIRDYEEQGYPECYVSITYNYLIKDDKTILGYFIDDNEYESLGTPADIERYNNEHR